MNSLYCYLGSEGLIFLKRGFLPFQSLEQLPEPWLQSAAFYQAQKESLPSAQDYQLHLEQQYQKLPQHLRVMVNFEYFVQQSQAKREQIEKSLVKQNTERSVGAEFDLARLQDWRVLRLNTAWDDIDSWQQLAAKGQGLIIEFDLANCGFKSADYNQHAQHFSELTAVKYWRPMDDLYYLFNRPLLNTKANGEQESIKAQTQEWRLARSIQAADRKIEVQGANRAMYRLPAKAVKRIILGYCCQADYCQQVKTYLKQDIHYRHVDCVQAQLDTRTMQLQQVSL